jgi:hypothetical protein
MAETRKLQYVHNLNTNKLELRSCSSLLLITTVGTAIKYMPLPFFGTNV